MTDSLEARIEGAEKPTLRQELAESIRVYPQTWKSYFKQLAPASIASITGAALGQWAMTSSGHDSAAANTAVAYVCGYVSGYTTFFTLEYYRHKDKYPNGILSKEFAHTVGTFMAADWVADATTFTPTFITANVYMMHHTNIHPAIRSVIAFSGGSLLYISAMSALHPVARRITNEIQKVYRSLRHRTHSESNSHNRTSA